MTCDAVSTRKGDKCSRKKPYKYLTTSLCVNTAETLKNRLRYYKTVNHIASKMYIILPVITQANDSTLLTTSIL